MRKHYERHIDIFSNSQKRLSLLHAQVNEKCPESSHLPLKRNCSTKWIENYDAVFVFKEFYPAVVGSLDQLSESREGEVLERAMIYLKAITAGFLVSLEQGCQTHFHRGPYQHYGCSQRASCKC